MARQALQTEAMEEEPLLSVIVLSTRMAYGNSSCAPDSQPSVSLRCKFLCLSWIEINLNHSPAGAWTASGKSLYAHGTTMTCDETQSCAAAHLSCTHACSQAGSCTHERVQGGSQEGRDTCNGTFIIQTACSSHDGMTGGAGSPGWAAQG